MGGWGEREEGRDGGREDGRYSDRERDGDREQTKVSLGLHFLRDSHPNNNYIT